MQLLIGYIVALNFARGRCGRLMDAMGWILLTYIRSFMMHVFDTGGIVGRPLSVRRDMKGFP